MSEEEGSFGAWLGRQLRRQGVSQSELATELGVTRAAVSAWVTGRATPRMEKIEEIERALGLSAGSMMSREDAEDSTDDLFWYHRPAHTDGGRELGNAAAFAFDADLSVLAREATQNSLDERYDQERPVRVRYLLHEISGERLNRFLDAIGWQDLEPHYLAAADRRQKVGRVLADGLVDLRDTGKLLLLRVDDYNASGLTGDDYEDGRFAAVIRRQLDSHKRSGAAGGSYGLGKATLWASSKLGMVLVNSTLSEPFGGRHERRLIGRLDLPWRQVEGTGYAGPAWLGVPDSHRGDGARSWWADERTVENLFLTRESNAPGTSFLIVGAHDAAGDGSSLEDMHHALVESLASSFWASMVSSSSEQPLLQASVTAMRDGNVIVAEEQVDPHRYQPARSRAVQAFLDGTTTKTLTSADSVVQVGVKLVVPPLKGDVTAGTRDHEAVLLLTPTDEDDDAPNRLVCMRSTRMVVMERPVGDLPMGTGKFQAVLLAGHAAGTASADAAEQFLRAAEPPEHNAWKRTDDLTATYARGAISRIEEFRRAMIDEIRKVVRRPEETSEWGPSVLQDLLRLDSGPSVNRAPGYPTVRHVDGELGSDGAWNVRVEVRLPERPDPWLLSPVLRFSTRSGPKPQAGWAELRAESHCEVTSDSRLLFEPGQRNAVFHGVSDVATHPVAAQMAAVEVDLERVKEIVR